jgi:hypothetical protein
MYVDLNRIAELEHTIEQCKEHLADCESRRPTDYLRSLMLEWAGTEEIDFTYVSDIIRYGLEEEQDCLWKAKRSYSHMCLA